MIGLSYGVKGGIDYDMLADVLTNTTITTNDLEIESTFSMEVVVSAASGSQTLLAPSSGKRLETRGIYIFTSANAGIISVEFQTSGQVLAKLYASRYASTTMPRCKFLGNIDESLTLVWDGLTSGDAIFTVIVYREI